MSFEGFIRMKEVEIGDYLLKIENDRNEKAKHCRVVGIRNLIKKGYYAPLTVSGTILVNGFYVSCYSEVKSHDLGHKAMFILALSSLIKMQVFKNRKEQDGIHPYGSFLLKLTKLLHLEKNVLC